MPSVTYPQAENLSTCSVSPPLFDQLVVDQFTPIVPIEEIRTCVNRVAVTSLDIPPIGIVTSGGAMNTDAVHYTALGEVTTVGLEHRLHFNGDALTLCNVALPQHETQVALLGSLFRQKVGQLCFVEPSISGFKNFTDYAPENPGGVIHVGGGFDIEILADLRALISPFTWDSPLVYVMNVATFGKLEAAARALGAPVTYEHSALFAGRAAFYDGFPIALTGHIAANEAGATTSVYLMRLGTGGDAPDGIKGFRFCVQEGRRGVQVIGPVPSSGTEDESITTLRLDIGVLPGSVGQCARADGIIS